MPSNSTDESTDSSVTSDISILSASELRVVLVCDVVESVRWMEHDEDNAITRWSQFAAHVRQHIAPAQGGSVVKSTGDGLVMEFANARDAVQAASAMHQHASAGNDGMPPEQQMHLRTGIHEAAIRRDAHDIYGHGVNLAARITTLAGPGEVIISAPVRDYLTDGLDGDIEDMGDCYLKHVSEPQRVYRVGAMGQSLPSPTVNIEGVIRLAVIPLRSLDGMTDQWPIGQLVADSVIGQLGQSKNIKVVSRLSSQSFSHGNHTPQQIGTALGVSYMLTGTYAHVPQGLLLIVELARCRDGEVLWTKRLVTQTNQLCEIHSEPCEQIAISVHEKITQVEVTQSMNKPLPTLQAYTLLLTGIHMMHRPSMQDFDRSYHYLDSLVERHGRYAVAYAWRARWRLMRVVNGLSSTPKVDTSIALQDVNKALELDSTHPLSLSILGQISSQLKGNGDVAKDTFENALSRDASEPVAWVFKSIHSSMWGDTNLAVLEAHEAISLSRLDPHQYHYQMALANALLSNNEHAKAIVAAKNSLRLNATHTATLRILITALYETDQIDQAKIALQRLLTLQPALTLKTYADIGSVQSRTRQRGYAALHGLGLTS